MTIYLKTPFGFFLVAVFCFFHSCSSSSNNTQAHFSHPNDFALTGSFNGKNFAYISNEGNGFISLIDLQESDVIDLDERMDLDQGLFIGGFPKSVAVAADSTHEWSYLLAALVQTEENSQVSLMGVTTDGESFGHEFITLSSEVSGQISDLTFTNEGQNSDPVVVSASIGEGVSENALWVLAFDEDQQNYTLTKYPGTETTALLQNERLTEGQSYSSDAGEVNLKIDAGLNPTTNGDQFTFYTSAYQPLIISGMAIQMEASDGFLIILSILDDQTTLTLFDMESLTVIDEFSTAARALGFAVVDEEGADSIWVNFGNSDDTDGDSIADNRSLLVLPLNETGFDEATAATTVFPSTIRQIAYDADSDALYAAGNQAVYLLNPNDGTISRTLSLSENLSLFYLSTPLSPSVFERLSEASDETRPVLFAGEIAGNLKIIDTLQFSDEAIDPIIDPYLNSGGKESEFTTAVFFDHGEVSEPEIKSIKTEDGATLDEEWLIIYEGEVFTSSDATGFLVSSDDSSDIESDGLFRYTLTDAAADFSSLSIAPQFYIDEAGIPAENDAYDAIWLDGVGSTSAIIENILSSTELTLVSEEDLSDFLSDGQSYSIHAFESYLVFGTSSGIQANRALGNASFISDGNEIAFTIRESALSPTTTGDYFAFDTYEYEGTDFISLGNLPKAAFEYSFDDDNFIYFIASGANSIKSFNLKTMREARTIR